jgi:hypothetical protein
MKWPTWKRLRHHDPSADERLEEAERRATHLEARVDKVVPHLTARLDRNHWTATTQAIIRSRRA